MTLFRKSVTVAAAIVLVACNAPQSLKHDASHGAAPKHAHTMMMDVASDEHQRSLDQLIGDYRPPAALNLGAMRALQKEQSKWMKKRVIYVGETHDRLDHHLNQLTIIKHQFQLTPNLAIGMEFFQQPFQPVLDDFIAGRISEKEMLKKTEYYSRWGFDYRLYKPIMDFARENRIPVIALDLPMEIRRKVGRQGIESLSEEERLALPEEIDLSDSHYRDLLMASFRGHTNLKSQFDNFFAAQVVRDETMAEQVVDYLNAHPGHRMVVLAGAGHLDYGSGIPNRVKRRMSAIDALIVLNFSGFELDTAVGDYVLSTQELPLPSSGKLGVYLESVAEGGVSVSRFAGGSPAEEAGLLVDDIIVAVDDEPIADLTDLKYYLMSKRPNESVAVKVTRVQKDEKKDREFSISLR